MGKKSQLPIAEREEVVLRLLRKEEPTAALARRWRDEFLAGGRARLAKGKGEEKEMAKRIVKLEQELARRAQVIGELRPRAPRFILCSR